MNTNKEKLNKIFNPHHKFNDLKLQLRMDRHKKHLNKKNSIKKNIESQLKLLKNTKKYFEKNVYENQKTHNYVNKRYLKKLYESVNNSKDNKKINNILKKRPTKNTRNQMWNILKNKYSEFFKNNPNFFENYIKNINLANIRNETNKANYRSKKISNLEKELKRIKWN